MEGELGIEKTSPPIQAIERHTIKVNRAGVREALLTTTLHSALLHLDENKCGVVVVCHGGGPFTITCAALVKKRICYSYNFQLPMHMPF